MTTRPIRAVVVAVLAFTCAGGCSDTGASEPTAAASVSTLEAIIIDVRTAEEFAAGHLAGALLIDIKDASFDARIAELDPDADYIVYCRSGNRSAQAVTRMREAGIRNITDLGSLENASEETGVEIVQG